MRRAVGVLVIALLLSACGPEASPPSSASTGAATLGTNGNAIYPIVAVAPEFHAIGVHSRRQSDFHDVACQSLAIASELQEPGGGCPRPKDRPVEKWGAE